MIRTQYENADELEKHEGEITSNSQLHWASVIPQRDYKQLSNNGWKENDGGRYNGNILSINIRGSENYFFRSPSLYYC